MRIGLLIAGVIAFFFGTQILLQAESVYHEILAALCAVAGTVCFSGAGIIWELTKCRQNLEWLNDKWGNKGFDSKP